MKYFLRIDGEDILLVRRQSDIGVIFLEDIEDNKGYRGYRVFDETSLPTGLLDGSKTYKLVNGEFVEQI
jgi:hypothetical protein